MQGTLITTVGVAIMVLGGNAQAHWGPYHYMKFEVQGKVHEIRVKGNKWDCESKHRWDLHWSEKFISCSD